MTAPDINANASPTASERQFFHTHGYLVFEKFLSPGHVARLLTALDQAVPRRRAEVPPGWKSTWPAQTKADLTQLHGEKSIRLLHILEDDPQFLELLTWPAILPYFKTLLNPNPHYHASDAIVEQGRDYLQRAGDWHIDGNYNGYRGLGWPIPLLQLKVGYYLSDMTQPWRGNLTVVAGSHLARWTRRPRIANGGSFSRARCRSARLRARRSCFTTRFGIPQRRLTSPMTGGKSCITATNIRGCSARSPTGITARNSTISGSIRSSANSSTASSLTRRSSGFSPLPTLTKCAKLDGHYPRLVAYLTTTLNQNHLSRDSHFNPPVSGGRSPSP